MLTAMVARDEGRASPYIEQQYAENYPPGVEHTYWHLARNAIMAENLRRLHSQVVLDIGCGRGILVEYLNQHRFEAYGVDPGAVPVPAHLQGKLYAGVTAQQLPSELRSRFDTIILGDVIEHIEDPHSFLLDLQNSFPHVRGFILTVPARTELWSNYDEYYGHYRRYDLNSLRREVEQSGMQVEEVAYFFKLLYPLMWMILKLRGRRSTQLRGPAGGAALHRVLAGMLWADYHVLPSAMYGTSALCRAIVREPR